MRKPCKALIVLAFATSREGRSTHLVHFGLRELEVILMSVDDNAKHLKAGCIGDVLFLLVEYYASA